MERLEHKHALYKRLESLQLAVPASGYNGKYQYDSSYLIGEEDGSYVFHKIGGILAVLESRWGYLFFVVIITLLLFLEELYELYMEIKYGNEITTVKEG